MSLNFNKLFKVEGTILLSGETGTGKSYLARTIHKRTKKDKNFVSLNMASVCESLFESTLFGHVKGSFTGAVCDRPGVCKVVGKGTLFLDEIAESSLGQQKKLLQLLEEKTFTAVGSNKEQIFEGRVIAATNKDLKKMVEDGKFREDLYFRLLVFNYELIPVRNHFDKKKKLLYEYFEKFKRLYCKPELELRAEAKKVLYNHSWPGNIREIKNCMDYIVQCTEGDMVKPSDLPKWLNNSKCSGITQHDYYSALESFEKDLFENAIRKNRGMVNLTAKKLGVSKTTLIAKLRKYGINSQLIKDNLQSRHLRTL